MKTHWRKTLKELGFGPFIVVSIDAVLRRLSSKLGMSMHFLVAQPVPGEPILAASRGKSIAVRRIEPDDPILAEFDRPAAEIESRYANGGIAFAAFKEERLVGFLWLTTLRYRETDLRCAR